MPDEKIGQYARDFFEEYFSDQNKQYNLTNFLNKYWCYDNFGIRYPLLKEVDITIPITEQKTYNNDYARYWTKPILKINGTHYIMCSQWFEEFREKLNNWIQKNENTGKNSYKTDCIHYDFKKDICSNLNHPIFNQPCASPTSCKYYSNKVIYILSMQEFKQRICPCCKEKTEEKKIEVHYVKNQNPFLSVTNQLLALRCDKCKMSFINENLFKNYTRTKDLDCLDVKFIHLKK